MAYKRSQTFMKKKKSEIKKQRIQLFIGPGKKGRGNTATLYTLMKKLALFSGKNKKAKMEFTRYNNM